MKTLFLTLVTFFTAFFNQAVLADTYNNFGYDGNKIIFVEGNVEFSVFPDGQFDFVFLGHEGTDVTISNPNMSVTFNSGYNYDAYVQYDMYGAVIQIENVPIYYDDFGRIRASTATDARNRSRPSLANGFTARHSCACCGRGSSRACHCGRARRTSSWWMNNSAVLTSRSTHPNPPSDQRGGCRSTATNSSNDTSSARARALAPPNRAVQGRRSRTTRCTARSRAVHPSHSVGACGPTSTSRSHSAARSARARLTAAFRSTSPPTHKPDHPGFLLTFCRLRPCPRGTRPNPL